MYVNFRIKHIELRATKSPPNDFSHNLNTEKELEDLLS